ncbi:MAG: hypothetical protein SF162_08800, partial [bacterium]|nr:hypothetical protein [bacterium]
LPSPPAEVLTEADARRQFVGLLIPVNRALRVIWIQTHGQHSLPQLDAAPAVQGYELCTDTLLRRELYNFDQLKGVMGRSADTTLLDSLFRFFSDLRDFFNAWVDYRISTFGAEAAGTLDGVLNASGAYYLADAVLHWRQNYPYLAGGLNGESLRIEWASRAGVFVDVTEWGSQRAQSADILWGIVEQLGGEDVRTSAVFQNSSRAADTVTSIATFFLDVRGVYNLVRGAGGAIGTATRSGTLPPGAVVGGGAAALAPYLARVAVLADEVPWATAVHPSHGDELRHGMDDLVDLDRAGQHRIEIVQHPVQAVGIVRHRIDGDDDQRIERRIAPQRLHQRPRPGARQPQIDHQHVRYGLGRDEGEGIIKRGRFQCLKAIGVQRGDVCHPADMVATRHENVHVLSLLHHPEPRNGFVICLFDIIRFVTHCRAVFGSDQPGQKSYLREANGRCNERLTSVLQQ